MTPFNFPLEIASQFLLINPPSSTCCKLPPCLFPEFKTNTHVLRQHAFACTEAEEQTVKPKSLIYKAKGNCVICLLKMLE